MHKLLILVALTFAGPALATDLAKDMFLGTTMPEVQSKLTDMGYEVRKSEMEDGKIEVYFVKDNKMGEVYVSPVTGNITKLKIE